MKKVLSCLMSASLSAIFCSSSFAGMPLGGLAVTVSPAGDVLVVGGDNRALLIADAAKMEVTNRLWLGVCIVEVQFNKDGSQLLVEDNDGTVHQIDTKTWEVVKSEKKPHE